MAGAWDPVNPPELDLIRDCVHCGFCLPTCPSYAVFEEEMDSPRGRVLLMRVGHEEGESISEEMVHHFDRCLGCMACVTACPSGVQYDRLIERTRPQLERHGPRRLRERALRGAVFAIFTHPGRLRALVPAMALGDRLRLRERFGERLTFLRLAPPARLSQAVTRLPPVTPAVGQRRGTVAFMQGCVQRVFFGDVNAATVRVLAAEGFEVHAPRQPRCCGALEFHAGLEDGARALARATAEAYSGYDVVLTNVAGCGSAMKDYGHLFGEDPAMSEFSSRVRDVQEFLDGVEPRAPRHPLALRAAYHDACHLAHAQGVREAPRRLLRAIPDLQLLEPREWELCCGSAGIYNLTQPEAAAKLGRRKAENLRATDPEAVIAANPGCAIQIAAYLDRPIYHPMTLLDHSIRGSRP
ncbi:MAG TPA: (Fe-S)-binding protein [Solirubrobacteraceae bacterium]|nr:(Fe-S)-binding protein [Solirubrobacteraceae bacterium]